MGILGKLEQLRNSELPMAGTHSGKTKQEQELHGKLGNTIKDDYYLIPGTGLLADKEEKLVVPRNRIAEILKMNHDHMLSGHLGSAKTLARIRRQYVWPGMGADVKQYVKIV